jgi:hypothetical protein
MSLIPEAERRRTDYTRARRKADQHWDMAGLARQDGDKKDAERHTALAREYEQLARELK